ncbi:AAA family ATPase [Candidatus Babela massiliensis]|uniref:ATPase of the AAA+ class n=1 Tax=Candidatus Babela massiliensis TaxID=673862 RepID=V6DHE9_9BACT|nr:AAA family ATPase [Candidatus Babela massiliensis]CDK30388.1 ATPase of the AAA+ class [Candidatus Babela massiliensis]
MKKQKLLLIFIIITSISKTFGMQDPKAAGTGILNAVQQFTESPLGQGVINGMEWIEERINKGVNFIEKKLQENLKTSETQALDAQRTKIRSYKRKRDSYYTTPQEKAELNEKIRICKEEKKKIREKYENKREQLKDKITEELQKTTDMSRRMVEENNRAENDLKSKAVEASIVAEHNVIIATKWIAAAPVITVVGCGAWHGSKIVANQIQKYLNYIPTIAEETSLISTKEKLVNYLTGKKFESNINDVILEKDLSERVSKLSQAIKCATENEAYFRHMTFYGPPGTGKTMLAKRIARSSGLEYIYFAGGSALDQLPIEDALARLVELFEFAKRSSKKLMIIIDEAEVLLADRSKNLSDKTRKLLNLILGYTGTETNNFIIVALTNRPEDLDSAFLSRCDEKIAIGVPGLEQRVGILELYINKFLIEKTKVQPQPKLLQRIMGAKNPPKPISIEKDALDSDIIMEIAQKLEGFVGRDIAKLVIAIQSEAYITPNRCVTKEIIEKVVQQKIEQKLLEDKEFKE